MPISVTFKSQNSLLNRYVHWKGICPFKIVISSQINQTRVQFPENSVRKLWSTLQSFRFNRTEQRFLVDHCTLTLFTYIINISIFGGLFEITHQWSNDHDVFFVKKCSSWLDQSSLFNAKILMILTANWPKEEGFVLTARSIVMEETSSVFN